MPQDSQSYTVDQLASDIKAKLPRYKDVDNQKLVNDWVKKYPKYGDHLQAQAAPAKWAAHAKPGPYNTQLSPDEEPKFQSWVKQNKIPWQDSPTSDYDMRGFWQAQQKGDPYAKRNAQNLHFPDTYKTPYHETFSNESKYALPTAGHWEGDKFVPPQKKGGVSFAEQHPFQASFAQSVGLDPEKLSQGSISDQHKELLHQVYKTQWPALKNFVKGSIKDPLTLAKPIDQLATGVQQAGGKIYQGLATGKHDLAWQGGGELLGNLAQIFSMAEGSKKYSSLVDGHIKAAADMAEKIKADPVEAATAAHSSARGVVGRILHKRAVLDEYADSGGMGLKTDVKNASNAVRKEIADSAGNVEKQIDTAIPSGVIDATKFATDTQTLLDNIVKTNEKVHASIKEALAEAKKTAPGQWSMEAARQLHSAIGRAAGHIEGPQSKVAWSIYKNLGDATQAVADKYSLGKEWKHYIDLASDYHQLYGKMVDDIGDATHGEQVSSILNKSSGLLNRFTKSFEQYGLNSKKVQKYADLSNKIIRLRGTQGQFSPFRLAYRTKAGLGGMIAGRLATGSWLGGIGAGAAAGLMSVQLTDAIRAARLSPEVLEHITENLILEGKMARTKGKFPDSEPPTAKPSGTTVPPTPKAPKAAPSVSPMSVPYQKPETASPTVPTVVPPVESKPGIVTPVPKAEPKAASSEAVGREPGAKEGTTRESKIGRATKARERVAKVRAEKGATALGGGGKVISGEGVGQKAAEEQAAKEAMSRVQSKSIDVSTMQIPELEEAMKELAPEELSNLQEGRREMRWSDQDYISGLRYEYAYALERSSGTPEK